MTRLGASRMSSVLGLKVRPSTATVFALQRAATGGDDFGGHRALARIVHPHHRFHDLDRHAIALPDGGERGGILRKTRTAESRAGVQEPSCETPNESHSGPDLLHVPPAAP